MGIARGSYQLHRQTMQTTPHTQAGRMLTKLMVWALYFDLEGAQ